MDIYNTIKTRRSIRAFTDRPIEFGVLEKMVELGSLGPSRLNQQPWEFIIITDKKIRAQVFDNILWGIKNPVNKAFADKRSSPAAYILVLVNKDIRSEGYQYEVGSSIENMLLYAWDQGIGSVWIRSFNAAKLKEIMSVPDNFLLDSLVAFGYPGHVSETCKMSGNDYAFSLDKRRNIRVPKRDPKDISHINTYGNKS